MGKLNIAHHKSYHPYRRDNIERVRRDEDEARAREAVEEGRMMLADSEARIDLLRQRAGLQAASSSKSKRKEKEKDGTDLDRAIAARDREQEQDHARDEAGPSTLTGPTGHINLFEDLERQTATTLVMRPMRKPGARGAGEKEGEVESEKGVALAPSAKDLNPWYKDGSRDLERGREADENRRIRDLARKSVHDPLTSINSQLATSARTSPRAPPPRPYRPSAPAASSSGTSDPAFAERHTRESSERQRALDLIRRKKREADGSETPSTVYGGGGGGGGRYGYGYGDVFNRREVEDVHRARRDGGWDRDRDRDRDREARGRGYSEGADGRARRR